eukprot:scaffold43230_cov37-Tisochrysis_lutea.AAC.2
MIDRVLGASLSAQPARANVQIASATRVSDACRALFTHRVSSSSKDASSSAWSNLPCAMHSLIVSIVDLVASLDKVLVWRPEVSRSGPKTASLTPLDMHRSI